ncbi:N-acetylneuraminate synthase family protein [Rhizobium sp. YJ-22]|uniref:N-acetylneuraminate synthase family protein n=1 Tax=Rhizobium sp. YJ-22 TaxID=3037556 RepID=UPI0024122CED|nr:N-acetylneuraminate synthase family protein [Rhizobium sp. YJ-22]MDG3575266.1 N-acetylneuraminate synthase family protein [Rhizobium sp. YJ-22]
MAIVTLRNGRRIGDYLAPYVIAELNTSHFGDMAIARQMIDQAKAAGCDCVKFQSWSTQSLYANSYYRTNAIAKRIVNKFALPDDALAELAAYACEIGIDFASTPYSRHEAEFLVRTCAVPFVKIASMELNNLPYLRYLGELGAPLVLSTGMGTLEEIIRAVRAIEKTGNRQIIVLHCTSVYPAPPEVIRLNNILGLRSEFPDYPIGYSDHSIGSEIPAAAIALGAAVIEKHFTLDSSRIGMDNQMATEPEEMKTMIAACHKVHAALGGSGRILDPSEIDQIPKMRRSIVSARALTAGTVLSVDDLDAKRPGTGIAPTEIDRVIGKRLLVDLESDETLLPEHFE